MSTRSTTVAEKAKDKKDERPKGNGCWVEEVEKADELSGVGVPEARRMVETVEEHEKPKE